MRENETIICRCEDLTLEDINGLIAAGFETMEEIKRISRCGMGPCQGTTCFPLLAEAIASMRGKRVGEVALPTSRPPLKPVKLDTIAGRTPARDKQS